MVLNDSQAGATSQCPAEHWMNIKWALAVPRPLEWMLNILPLSPYFQPLFSESSWERRTETTPLTSPSEPRREGGRTEPRREGGRTLTRYIESLFREEKIGRPVDGNEKSTGMRRDWRHSSHGTWRGSGLIDSDDLIINFGNEANNCA